MSLALLKRTVTERDVEVAWATYRALLLAEIDDVSLNDSIAHQRAISEAQERFARLYDEWGRQP